jgi:hypothetical protein
MSFGGPLYSYTGVPIHAVYAQKDAYDSYPSCQRDYVWSSQMQQKLIDSILRGLPIPPITVLPASEHDLMGTRFWIVDGQQRLKTVLRFLEGEFKTATTFTLEPGIKPLEAGRFFEQLTPAAQNDFNFYQLQFCHVRNVESQSTGLIYRRFNYQMKLKFAEMLYSYESKAKQLVESLFDHSFWKVIYGGKTDRKQVFIMGMHLIYMEVMDIFANMTSPQLAEMAQGKKDNLITSDLKGKIAATLKGLENVFYGATLNSYGEIIPIYQAGLLLENDGYDLAKSKRGCLATWYMKMKEHALTSRREGISSPITILANVNRQREFWIKNLSVLYEHGNQLVKKDKRRSFSQLDKLKAWNKQQGKCKVCGKPVRISDVGHHAEPHSKGGKTSSDNCWLIHAECHQSIHNKPLTMFDDEK